MKGGGDGACRGLNGEQESLFAHFIPANWPSILSYSDKDGESECISSVYTDLITPVMEKENCAASSLNC